MRLIDADHLKKWILARWQERNPQTDRPFKAIEILDQIDREMTFKAQPKTGYWIEFPNHNAYVCSECSRIIKTTDGKNNVYRHYPYCHCGAKMLKEGDGRD